MTTTATVLPVPTPPRRGPRTIADLLRRLGVPANRVLAVPPPGTATEQDLLEAIDRLGRPLELINGTLVEKAVGNDESAVAAYLVYVLSAVVVPGKLGTIFGADSLFRCLPRRVRSPDVAFVAKSQIPNGRPTTPIWGFGPALVVEVLSRSNTRREMQLKRRLLFGAGTELFWIVDPRRRTVRVYTDPRQFTTLTATDRLTGGTVLPGFDVSVADVFSPLDA
jgi:Uma2 family endonuclease